MKKTIWLMTFFFSFVAVCYAQTTTGGAQRRPRSGTPAYDPATEVTVKGSIEEVKQQTGMPGTHLILKTDKESLDVRLGPSAFLTAHKFEIAKGDQIEVTGSKVKLAGLDVILAREVKKGDTILTLRNAQGIPEWSRGRRGQMKM
jgi:hypothetical protein